MQRSRTFISSMLALSLALTGIFALTSHNSAIALSKDGLGIIKDDAQVYRRQAMEYFASGNDSLCLEFYQKAIDQAVKDLGPTSSYVSDLYFEMGCAAKQRAKFPTAEHCFLEALKHRPNSIPARLQLASVYTSQGKRAEAFAQIKAAKIKNPHSPQAQSALVCYIQGMNRPAEAAHEASLIKSMLPNAKNGSVNAAPGISHFNGLTELKVPTAGSEHKGKEVKETKEPKDTNKASEKATLVGKEGKEGKEEKEGTEQKVKASASPAPSTTAPMVENRMPASLGSSSVLKGLMHGTVNQQPAATPIMTPVATPQPAPAPVKVDDRELELAKAKAQLETMRKKLEAAEHDKAPTGKHDVHEQSKHADSHKKHSEAKHPAKSHDDAGTDVAGRAAVLQTKAILEKQEPKKKSPAFNKVQSNVPSDKSSGDSSRSDDGGGENKPKMTSDLRHVPPEEGVKSLQYVPIAMPPAPKKPKVHGTTMVPPPPPTPVFNSMPIMQPPPMVAPPKPKPRPKPAPKPQAAEEDSSASASSPSPKASEDDTKFLLDWGGAGEKHKRAKAKD